MPVINRMGMSMPDSRPSTFAKKRDELKSQVGGTTDKSTGYNIDQLREQANRMGADSNDYKYQIATEMARSELGDEADRDDDKFRETIDAYYDQLDPTNTGRDQRGQNGITDLIDMGGDFFDDVAEVGGQGIDWLWDNTVGNVAGILGEDFGTTVKDLVTPESGAAIADMLVDLGLSAIPGVGLGLSAGKNMLQNADTITQAITGRDVTTGEDIGEWGRLGNVGSALLTVGGGLLPAVGKTRNLLRANKVANAAAGSADDAAKAAGKAAAGSADDAAEVAGKAAAGRPNALKVAAKAAAGSADDAAEVSGKAAASAVDNAAQISSRAEQPSQVMQAIRNVADSVKGKGRTAADVASARRSLARDKYDTIVKEATEAGRPIRGAVHGRASQAGTLLGTPREIRQRVLPTLRERELGIPDREIARTMEQLQSIENAAKAAERAEKSGRVRRTLGTFAGDIMPGMLANAGMLVGSGTLGAMANTNLNPGDAAAVLADTLKEDPQTLVALISSPGVGAVGRRMPGPSGGASRLNLPALGARAATVTRSAVEEPSTADYDRIDTRGMTQDELLDWMLWQQMQSGGNDASWTE